MSAFSAMRVVTHSSQMTLGRTCFSVRFSIRYAVNYKVWLLCVLMCWFHMLAYPACLLCALYNVGLCVYVCIC